MKKYILIMVLGTLVACLVPANAQTQQDFQSTSTMRGTGSSLAPQVTAVGATQVGESATPSDNVGPARTPGMRKDLIGGTDGPHGPSPIGDAALPLALMALGFAGVVYFRKRRAQEAK